MKHEVRDDNVEPFGWGECEYVAILEINPVRVAKNLRVLFRPLETGAFEAGVLERINPGNPRVLVEFSADTTQESETTSYVENLQLVISAERKRCESIREQTLDDHTDLLRGRTRRIVVGPEVGFLLRHFLSKRSLIGHPYPVRSRGARGAFRTINCAEIPPPVHDFNELVCRLSVVSVPRGLQKNLLKILALRQDLISFRVVEDVFELSSLVRQVHGENDADPSREVSFWVVCDKLIMRRGARECFLRQNN